MSVTIAGMARCATRTGFGTVFLLVMLFVAPVHTLAARPAIHADGVLAYTNAERYKENLPFLSTNAELSRAAYVKMQDLFANQYFAHEAPNGDSIVELATDAGYSYSSVGENLALGGFDSSKAVVDAWMDSPGHRKNILKPTYQEIGIAAGRGEYKGKIAWIVVQAFGTPRSLCPLPDHDLRERVEQGENTLMLMRRVADMRKQLFEDTSPNHPAYQKRIEAFRLAASVHNDYLDTRREEIDTYNAQVERYNACLTRLSTS
jgi:hypothetical protein